jgi:hypothetical protein
MATNSGSKKPGSESVGLPTHPLVQKLVVESDSPDPVPWVVLTGYLGPSPDAERMRVYTSLDFHDYYLVPRSAVGAAVPVDGGDENSPTNVLVQSDATVKLVQISTQSGPAAYFTGSIVGTHLPAAAASGAKAALFRPTVLGPCRTVTHQPCFFTNPDAECFPC